MLPWAISHARADRSLGARSPASSAGRTGGSGATRGAGRTSCSTPRAPRRPSGRSMSPTARAFPAVGISRRVRTCELTSSGPSQWKLPMVVPTRTRPACQADVHGHDPTAGRRAQMAPECVPVSRSVSVAMHRLPALYRTPPPPFRLPTGFHGFHSCRTESSVTYPPPRPFFASHTRGHRAFVPPPLLSPHATS